MAIHFDQENSLFTLQTAHSTYQMKVGKFGHLLHLYYGRKSSGDMSFLLHKGDRGFSGTPYESGKDRTYSMDFYPQEYPVQGSGDFRSPALMVRRENGAFGCDLRYVSHTITDGKYALALLPAVHAGDQDREGIQTLSIVLEDQLPGLRVELLYGVLPEIDVITRAVRITNTAENGEVITLEKAQSAVLDFTTGDFDVLTFHGRHAMERTLSRQAVPQGEFNIGSRRGMSSHQHNPLMILAGKDANETSGSCYAMEFVYSGGFRGEVGKDQFGSVRMQMGIMDEQFSYPLQAGETFTAPEVILSYSRDGLGQLSRNLHDCIRGHVMRGIWKDQVRPVLLNSWEASYFDFDGESLLKLAKEAKELDLDMLVLDDGWFADRCDDFRGLGDWTVNEKKLGCSLKELVEKVKNLGLKFGIWIEPEMANEGTKLLKEHPDWALVLPGRKPILSRSQLVLDFSRREVVDGIFDQICAVLDQAPIDYVKWDYNRSIADVYSAAETSAGQGKVLYDYILGLYDFNERLLKRYPNLLVEGCSGGGGRFDAGMLYYTPQIWCSDNSDAIDRLSIQYGTSFGYPCAAVGAHVSVCPNEQNGRVTPFATRATVAMAGTFGYELDPAKLSEEEKGAIRGQVKRFKEVAPLVLSGDYYRLTNPLEDEAGAWEIMSKDGRDILVSAVTLTTHGNMTPIYIPLQGLEEDAVYEEMSTGRRLGGGALMEAGLLIPTQMGEYHSYTWQFKRVD